MSDENATIPTEVEIRQLPRWARVAFAARCARLAQPFYPEVLPPVSQKHLQAIDDALRIVEHASAVNYALASFIASAELLFSTATAEFTQREINNTPLAAVEYAVSTARFAAAAADGADASAASFAADSSVVSIEVATAIRRDFDHLLSLSRELRWTDSTPVPPSVFDLHTDSSLRFALSAVVGPDVPAEVIERDLVGLYQAVNDYHIARGGSGLTLDQFKRLVEASVPAGV